MPSVQFRWNDSLHQRKLQVNQRLDSVLRQFLIHKRIPASSLSGYQLRHAHRGFIPLDETFRSLGLENNCVLEVVSQKKFSKKSSGNGQQSKTPIRVAVDIISAPGQKQRLVGQALRSSSLLEVLEAVEQQSNTVVTGLLLSRPLSPQTPEQEKTLKEFYNPDAPWLVPSVFVLGKKIDNLASLVNTTLHSLGVSSGSVVLKVEYIPSAGPNGQSLNRAQATSLADHLRENRLKKQRERLETREAERQSRLLQQQQMEVEAEQEKSPRHYSPPPPPPPEARSPRSASLKSGLKFDRDKAGVADLHRPEDFLGLSLVMDIWEALYSESQEARADNDFAMKDDEESKEDSVAQLSEQVLSTAAESLEVLGKVTRNLLLQKSNPKYRRLRGLENPSHSLWRKIGRFSSSLKYLEAIGFRPEADDSGEWSVADENYDRGVLQRCTQSALPEAFLKVEDLVKKAADLWEEAKQDSSSSSAPLPKESQVAAAVIGGRPDLQGSLIPESSSPSSGGQGSVFDWQKRQAGGEVEDVQMGGTGAPRSDYDLSRVRPLIQDLETETGDREVFLRALKLLVTITKNLQKPVENKNYNSFRNLNFHNIKLGSKLLCFQAACDYLEWLGFVRVQEDAQGEVAAVDVYCLLPEKENSTQIERASRVLQNLRQELEQRRRRRMSGLKFDLSGAHSAAPAEPFNGAAAASEAKETSSSSQASFSAPSAVPTAIAVPVAVPAPPSSAPAAAAGFQKSLRERPSHVLRLASVRPSAIAEQLAAEETLDAEAAEEALRKEDARILIQNRQASAQRNKILYPQDVILTSEKQQELLQKTKPVYDRLLVKVVFREEGLALQGLFAAQETLAHLFAWLHRFMKPGLRPHQGDTGALAGSSVVHPAVSTYGLKLWPATKISLGTQDPFTTLGELNLAPAATLHLYWEEKTSDFSSGVVLEEVKALQQDPTPQISAAPKPANLEELQEHQRQLELEAKFAKRNQGPKSSASSSASRSFANRLLRR